MKEVFKSVLEAIKDTFWLPVITREGVLSILYRFVLAAKMWALNLAIYFTTITTAFLICFLKGINPSTIGMWEFTRAYFYDGVFIFEAWRIHVVLYVISLILIFRE